jgi:hypothetical protein
LEQKVKNMALDSSEFADDDVGNAALAHINWGGLFGVSPAHMAYTLQIVDNLMQPAP